MRISLASCVVMSLVYSVNARSADAACVGGAPDGAVAPTENCDDGNNVNNDGCTNQCEIGGEFSCARSVSFANLSIQDFPGSTAQWTVAADNLSGVQTQNTPAPTIALFGEDAMRGSYVVRMEVLTTFDDDFIGLALGFNPGDQNNANANYLVIDWKQALQNGVGPGLRLAHVRGTANSGGTHITHAIPQRLCPNAATECVTQLANGRRFGTTGWLDQTPIEAIITYRPNRLEIRIDNVLELDVTPADFPGEFAGNVFPSGQIGFYLESQQEVRYTNLAPFGPSVCNVTALKPTTFDRPVGTPNVTIDTPNLLVDNGGDQLDPTSVVVTAVNGGGTAVVNANGTITFTPANPNVPGTYTVTVFACDNDPIIPDCDRAVMTINYGGDTDGDGIFDQLDLDDDDDGIPDRLENTLGIDPDGDRDNDGIANWRDKNDRGDGQASTCVDTTPANGICDRPGIEFDRDRDGIPNHLDLDSDNDGLLDVVEVFPGLPDANQDGRLDCPNGVGTNGLCDQFEVTADDGVIDWNTDDVGPDAALDTDGDGLPDFLDLDSDNDGIRDLVEGNAGCADAAPRDGRCDGGDGDGDGVVNSRDGKTGHGVAGYNDRPDTDSDGVADYRDLDSDNDGLDDTLEGGSNCTDSNPANAVCDGPDANGDGLADNAQVVQPPDSDGDAVADFRDLDSDDDGLPDLTEGGSGCSDNDGNAVCDGPDGDGDGVADSIDDTVGFGDGTPTVPTNTDGADQPDFRDPDSDNNGTPDTVVSGCTDTAPANQRCDGPDSDGDGVVDQADGFDGFGILRDTDGDGVGDAVDLDDDNDGIPDSVEAGKDTDGDGRTDDVDLDSDNDGLPDVVEAGHSAIDASGDGMVDCPSGFGANGLCDALETAPDSGAPNYQPVDTDNDGIADFRDLDADNDGISDRAENGSGCADQAPTGVCDGDDADRDGIPSSADHTAGYGAGGYMTPPDTDKDGTPDYRDLDSDGDGIFDIDEAGRGATDSDDDGIANGADRDGDGIIDTVDGDVGVFGGGGNGLDTDGDGMPDQRDLDADGDTLPDHDEAGDDPANPADSDGDGMPDFQDVDSDNDTVTDAPDNCRLTPNTDQADLDGDGIGDACDADANGDGLEDGLGVKGGGCATGGASSGAIVVLGLAWLALGRGQRQRRRRRVIAGAALVLASVSGLATRVAEAQPAELATSYPAERFQLTAHRDGLLGVEFADVEGHLAIDVGLWLGYADDPVNVYRMADGQRVASFVARRVGGDLVAALRLKNRVELQLGAPVIVAQSQDVGGLMAPPSGLSGFGLGDLRAAIKVALVRQEGGKRPLALALMAGVTLPTSTSDDYGGDDGATFSPALVVSHGTARGVRASLAVGYRVRSQTRVLDLVVNDEVFGGLGVGYRWGNSFELDGTLDIATGADDVFGAFNRNFGELRAGAGYDVARPVRLFAAGGIGIAEGFGTPDWRALVGVRIDPRPAAAGPARDNDRDRDGIVDALDKCPSEPETINQFEDRDGCPDDPDPDKDGVIGAADKCPTEPEDADGFEDGDGCPDPDNDKDGVLDVADRCRDQPGIVENQGCPDPDRDGDGIVDRKDACPEVAGLPALEGCPDRDGDGITDAKDNCPDEPGTVENQGCKAKQLVKIVGTKIEILDIVYFQTDRAVIQQRSFALLDNVASVLNAHPEITKVQVEGHTDDQGNDDYNKKLSQRRADAVVAYLVKKNVAAERLSGMGFGEERPKTTNATPAGRAENRRVEFTILQPH